MEDGNERASINKAHVKDEWMKEEAKGSESGPWRHGSRPRVANKLYMRGGSFGGITMRILGKWMSDVKWRYLTRHGI